MIMLFAIQSDFYSGKSIPCVANFKQRLSLTAEVLVSSFFKEQLAKESYQPLSSLDDFAGVKDSNSHLKDDDDDEGEKVGVRWWLDYTSCDTLRPSQQNCPSYTREDQSEQQR